MKTWNEVVEGYRERWIEIFSQGVEGFSEQACREIVYALTPKTGKWITDVYKRGKERHTCSECGEGSRYDSKYCPNCGADMRGDKDDR